MTADFTYEDSGGLILLHPVTPAALAWTLENDISGALVSEPRDADALLHTLAIAGLRVGNGAHGLN